MRTGGTATMDNRRRRRRIKPYESVLPLITLHLVSTVLEKYWEDIKFGGDDQVDFCTVSFVKDAQVVHELKNYLRSNNADIHVILKIESAGIHVI
ncbi:pyruvate kinase isozyme G, chloroplastic-like isoform X2 [Pyrus x bretschneideri]|uniref:pyruvate kinase isozyme G, chloroplastic-like isoform X2 n=1 Tax=Pyrus x bretschneideri TaxID=225117 RepID=UPI00202FD76A|nr:pyruvate kinase isozyme G, chloroplastic-like isoform X2 [Pyrus x bretschneideri]